MLGFDFVDLFVNWYFGVIIKRKFRNGGMADSLEVGRFGDFVKLVWLFQDLIYFIMWVDIVKI